MNPPSWPWLSFGADLLGILGFGLTVWTLVMVRKITAFYTGLGVTPQLQERIQTIVVNLESYLASYDTSKTVAEVQVRLLGENLRALERAVKLHERQSVKRLYEEIAKHQGAGATKESLWEIYGLGLQVLEQVKNVQEETKWRM